MWGFERRCGDVLFADDSAEVGAVIREVDQQRDVQPRCLEVRLHLRVMGLAERLYGLEFENHSTFYDEVETMPANFPTPVIDDDFLFDFGSETLSRELDDKRPTVNTLEESGTKHLMHVNNTKENPLRTLIVGKGDAARHITPHLQYPPLLLKSAEQEKWPSSQGADISRWAE
jgi:hypothetical protein